MRVGIDVSALAQTRAGIARYLTNLLPRLERAPGLELARLSFGGDNPAATLARDLWWYPSRLPRRAARAGLDVLHCPTYRAPFQSRVPLVVTVPDVAVFRLPNAFPLWTRRYSRIAVPHVVRAARRVIAISKFTRDELVEVLGVPPEKVRVVPMAAEGAFTEDGPAAEGNYVLAVGTLEPRKNLRRVAEATRRAGLELRIVGATGWGSVQANGTGVRWLGEVPDRDLAALYRGARCVAYPSLYEGFGIPVLEAMACGAPVVTSVGSAMEEVAGGAAVLVDPFDPASIASGIEEAASRRDELARLGLERARRYSWDEAARATAQVYREAAGG
jgi:glycosyltransferase involved in cell wall biosynthesis